MLGIALVCPVIWCLSPCTQRRAPSFFGTFSCPHLSEELDLSSASLDCEVVLEGLPGVVVDEIEFLVQLLHAILVLVLVVRMLHHGVDFLGDAGDLVDSVFGIRQQAKQTMMLILLFHRRLQDYLAEFVGHT